MWDRVTSLFDEEALEPALLRLVDDGSGGLVFVLLALLTAATIGAVHAVGPGHGKALIGAYLAGSSGRRRDAFALGGLVAAMHTGSVLVLGLALHATQRVPGGARLEPVLMLVSAAAVVAVGVGLLVRQAAARRRSRAPALVAVTGSPDGRHHHHHPAPPEGVPPLSRAGIVALATSGGLLPSPAAFLVLATAMAMGRTLFGLALVAAFSVGLAVTLTALGLAVLWGRDALGGRVNDARLVWLFGLVPPLAAAVVVAGGVVLGIAAILRW